MTWTRTMQVAAAAVGVCWSGAVALGQQIPTLAAELAAKRQQSIVRAFSIAAAREGELVHVQAEGKRDELSPVSPNTSFSIGSVTKQFTAALVLKLCEDRKLTLETRLTDRLPGLNVGPQVTLSRLLSHTSGLPEMLRFRQNLDVDWTTPVTTNDWISRLATLPAQAGSAPGSFSYCNTGYVLLGAVIEGASGTSLAAAYNDALLQPASLSRITFGPPSGGDVAKGFRGGIAIPAMHATRAGGAGGLYSTASDLVRWTWALRSGGLLSPKSTKEMFSPHATGGSLPGDQYGYGWFISQRGTFYHSGKVDGFLCVVAIFPAYKSEVHVALLTNEENAAGLEQLALGARTAVLQVENQRITSELKEVLSQIGSGQLDLARFGPELRGELTSPAMQQHIAAARSLGAAGAMKFVGAAAGNAVHQVVYQYRVQYGQARLLWNIGWNATGKIDSLSFQQVP